MDSPLTLAQLPLLIPPGARFQPEHNLRIRSFNSAAGVVLTIGVQFATDDGVVRSTIFTHTPNTDRSSKVDVFSLDGGVILSAHVFASTGTPRRGQCFVKLDVLRGTSATGPSFGLLLQGYVQDTTGLAYPGSPIEASTSGQGVLRSFTGTDPAAGAEISETVPTNARWLVRSVYFTLVTDANAANREPNVVIDDGTSTLLQSAACVTIPAGTTRSWTFAAWGALPAPAASTSLFGILPPGPLQGGWRIRTATTNLQVGDNYTAPQIHVEEWIED